MKAHYCGARRTTYHAHCALPMQSEGNERFHIHVSTAMSSLLMTRQPDQGAIQSQHLEKHGQYQHPETNQTRRTARPEIFGTTLGIGVVQGPPDAIVKAVKSDKKIKQKLRKSSTFQAYMNGERYPMKCIFAGIDRARHDDNSECTYTSLTA